MKKIILLFILINIISCDKPDTVKSYTHVINLNIKNKDLINLFLGNKYYGYKGISAKDSLTKYKLRYINSILELESKNNFIYDFKKGIVLEDSISFDLHDLNKIITNPVEIKFNNYKSKKGYFFPDITKENLEILKNRSTKIFSLNNDMTLVPIYLADQFKNSKTPNLNEILFYDSTRENLKKLLDFNIYPNNYSSFIIVHNPLSGKYSIIPNLKKFSKSKNSLTNNLLSNLNFEEPKSLNKTKDTVIVDSDFVINENKVFNNNIITFKKGINIILNNYSRLIFKNCEVNFLGENNEVIKIIGNKNNSLYFSNSTVKIMYSNFNNLSFYNDEELQLPSAITFYNSKVSINNSYFSNNYEGDDFINFYNSDFKINKLTMVNSNADAIDSDFSNGKIENISMKNIGNDALDFSGSNIEITDSSFDEVFDKAISAGEGSNIKIQNSKISNSELAIVVKDGSKLESYSNKMNSNKIDYAVFFKKDFYKPPILKTDSISNTNLNLFQKGVKIVTVNSFKVNYLEDVESMLYGKLYGKSSK